MATIPDVILTGTAYQNLYAATGTVLGTSVTLQNKSRDEIFIQNIASQPSSSSKNGWVLAPLEAVDVTGVIVGLWAFGTGPIMLEVII
ncbi:hypothetical protein phiPsa267_059 [Pseudomonas phage phiPsa267]|uniref:Uncharacterized protein n=3 Tax=Otagovirus TaxID=2560197 RepID=A0A7G9V113_9CAUD|nr:hypothetical protein QGX14_gp174 [Pseudomonas phage psageK4]YP_010766975.1 hypothetical protein QGX15_gp177 [Pseudomonas phage psageK4e]YP_010767669.1 hypothetical protein QGX19_gp171 [Pseudomonas phage phiPsa267]QNN99968.1 hypothetical protein phiPsa267_059 [Pseudomonas phage phiPsa267]QXV71715.1 hypothetical protein psageK4_061 [Pseudomonas phage psageK4]UAW53518.1 hypothetical protein psageK4e_070 [Pseudomonas phage psageK4e]